MQWLLPADGSNPSAAPTINVRAETITKKFKDALSNRRCLMPVNGFYEWRKQRRRRLPFHITVKNSPIYMLAAISGAFFVRLHSYLPGHHGGASSSDAGV